jgi:hypothetical protein
MIGCAKDRDTTFAEPTDIRIMIRLIALPFALLLLFVFAAPSVRAQVPADLVSSYTKLTKRSDKLIGQVNPWMDQVKKNEALIPADLKPQYESFDKQYRDYVGKFNLAKADPAKLTREALAAMSGDLGKLSSSFKGLQGAFKGLPFMK